MGALEDFLENRLDLDGFCRHLETVLGAYRRHALAPRGDEFEA
ncbi:MAG: hypothetical protein M5U26_20045 [Planctomycetota bacterium]|nr:hypothetical protein [Planctomycetota bacterium]